MSEQVSLEALVSTSQAGRGGGTKECHPLVQMVSDRIIVRASNPGQFESDVEASWSRDAATGTVFHMGNIGINTDNATESLTVSGNIQLTGQVLHPSDLRLKNVLGAMDSGHQLQNVNKLKLVQYQYKPEFIREMTEDGQGRRDPVRIPRKSTCGPLERIFPG